MDTNENNYLSYIEIKNKFFISINYNKCSGITHIDDILYEYKKPIRENSFYILNALNRLHLYKINLYINDYNTNKLILIGYYDEYEWIPNKSINYIKYFTKNGDYNYYKWWGSMRAINNFIYIEVPSKSLISKFKLII